MSKKYLRPKTKSMGEEMRKQAYYQESSYAEDFVMDPVSYAEDEEAEFSILEEAMRQFGQKDEEVSGDVFPTGDFSESDFSEEVGDMTLGEALKSLTDGPNDLGDLAEELEDLEESVDELVKEHGDVPMKELIPGSDISAEDLEDKAEDVETDYANDGDLTKFMDYIQSEYPANIPAHDGRSTTGCENAIYFLSRLNSEISKAIKADVDKVLDLAGLEEIRSNIMRDVITLKDHLKKLEKKLKDQHSKTADHAAPLWTTANGDSVDLVKEATTPNNMVICITPFMRAITGMMINAHVSSGKPMEEVYEALKEKYDITDREELSIIQICMDSGFPLFKDRGTVSDEKLSVDFLRNYLA